MFIFININSFVSSASFNIQIICQIPMFMPKKEEQSGFQFTKLLRTGSAWMLVWPLLCSALIAMLWLAVSAKINEERALLRQNLRHDAISISNGYAHFLKRTIEQMDQMTMQIQYNWEKSNDSLDLEDMVRRGLFSAPQFTLVAIFDRNGIPVSATKQFRRIPAISETEYFIRHKNHISSNLHIGLPERSSITGKTVIQLTRRLDHADDSFAGIILVSVEPEFFSSYYDGPALGKSGILAAIGMDGLLRVSRMGSVSHTEPGSDISALPIAESIQPDNMAKSVAGETWLSGHSFNDGLQRFVAWRPLEAYPLSVAIALPEEERLAPLRKNWETYYQLAFVGTVALLALAGIAMLFSRAYYRKKHEKKNVMKTYRLATEAGSEGFYILKPSFDEHKKINSLIVLDCNEKGAEFHGLSRNAFLNVQLENFYGKNGISFFKLAQACGLAIKHGFHEGEMEIEPNPVLKLQWARIKIVHAESGLAVTLQDISAAKNHHRELERLANTDELTGLPNRNWLMKYLPEKIRQASLDKRSLFILFIDLDNFKNVNDQFGHAAGDELLREAARRLNMLMRQTDHVVRLGGDEFTVLIELNEGPLHASVIAQRVINDFSIPFELSYGKCAVGASIGISNFPEDGASAEVLLQSADIAMYCAKADGKGSYCFYKPEFHETLKNRLDMTQALAHAITTDEFRLFYQPRVDALNGKLKSMEALIRWFSPERGLILPGEFIPLAENTGMITHLGAMVIEKACAQIAAWRNQGLPLFPVSINVSPLQFKQSDVKETVKACLHKYGLEPNLIEIELTETAMMADQLHISSQLASMREMGIKLAVDDFGTGYSSLSQLKKLDMDVLKVDRVFTSELDKSEEGKVFFNAILSMAHALGMRVVAEGVETRKQADILRDLKCDEIQGYFISRPVPSEDMASMLENQTFLWTLREVHSIKQSALID
jgi:diguanylate cyclase (GGDEF)-like protein